MTTPDLLAEVRLFLEETGMGPTYFGKLAANNPSFVQRLEAGRPYQIDTAERVRAFMAERRKAGATADAAE